MISVSTSQPIFQASSLQVPGPAHSAGPWVIAGLGNPGPEYERTRHNVGLWCIDELVTRARIKLARTDRRIRSAKTSIGGAPVVLVAPRTYVNDSGVAVRFALERFGSAPANLVVIADDINLATGDIRIRRSGSAGGHNGMKSIIAALGTDEFIRIRIGVGQPPGRGRRQIEFVLGEFSTTDRKLVDGAVMRAADAVAGIVADGIESTMNQFNRKPAVPEE